MDFTYTALQIQHNLQDKFFLTIFFSTNFFFSDKKSFCRILSGTGFCLGLHTTVVFHMQSFNDMIYSKEFQVQK